MNFILNISRVELALWTHFVAVQLKPELLDRIPTANTIANSGSTELETTATGDEAIKVDATSDEAEITADENSTDMVSSSKDEDDTTTDGDLKLEQNCISGKWSLENESLCLSEVKWGLDIHFEHIFSLN